MPIMNPVTRRNNYRIIYIIGQNNISKEQVLHKLADQIKSKTNYFLLTATRFNAFLVLKKQNILNCLLIIQII